MTTKRRLIEEAERVNPVVPVHAWRSPAGAAVDVVIVTALSVYATVHEQAVAALPNETGGFLVGRVGFDARDESWHLAVEEAVPVIPCEQHPTYFQFTWRDVDRVRTYREQHGKALLGWYHTHPDFGIFLSDTDLDKTHRVLFSEPFQIALVYDPVRSRAGYFFWEGAQYIDPGQAEWREFDLAFADMPEENVFVTDPALEFGEGELAHAQAQEPEPVSEEAREDPQPEVPTQEAPAPESAAGEVQGS
jgi:proteasome lid subunit RPN8/RPN11